MTGMHRLLQEAYLLPTPAGAYQAACTLQSGEARQFLFALMSENQSRCGALESLCAWSGITDSADALELLARLQALKLVQGEAQPRRLTEGPLEQILPDLLTALSSSGRALLADSQGLYVVTCGFTHETAEELAALSADIASLHQRHQGLLQHNMGLRTQAWALSDAAGNSQVGFWPLYIGDTSFVLIIGDMPCLNQPAFRDLIWALSCRYAVTPT